MSKRCLWKPVFFGTAAAVAMAAGLSWATPPSGTQSTLLGRATLDEEFKVKRAGADDWEVEVEAKPALDVATQVITFQPGGQSGWHTHPGPVFISVVSGTMTFYESNDPDCQPIVRTAGQVYLDAGDHPHIARNETSATAMNVVTYLAPPGAVLRIDAPTPGNCPF
jgi:quercetin dioxygenase-like cupin family protein